jgi:hypothetical protein
MNQRIHHFANALLGRSCFAPDNSANAAHTVTIPLDF